MRVSNLARTLLLGLVSFGLMSCTPSGTTGGATGSPSGQSPVGETASEVNSPSIASEDDLKAARALPLDAYSLNGTQIGLIHYAANLLAARCMAAQGFAFRATKPSTMTGVSVRNRLVMMFGVGVLSEVKQYGYDEPPQYVGTQKPSSPGASVVQQGADFEAALMGPVQDRPSLPPIDLGGGVQAGGSTYSPNSCFGKAYAALSVDDPRRLSTGTGSGLVARLAGDSDAKTRSDRRAVDVTKSWSACMASRGFTVANPGDAANTYGPQRKQIAIAAATADVECKYQTNYLGIMYGVKVAYEKAAIESNAEALATLGKDNDRILSKSNAVVQAG